MVSPLESIRVALGFVEPIIPSVWKLWGQDPAQEVECWIPTNLIALTGWFLLHIMFSSRGPMKMNNLMRLPGSARHQDWAPMKISNPRRWLRCPSRYSVWKPNLLLCPSMRERGYSSMMNKLNELMKTTYPPRNGMCFMQRLVLVTWTTIPSNRVNRIKNINQPCYVCRRCTIRTGIRSYVTSERMRNYLGRSRIGPITGVESVKWWRRRPKWWSWGPSITKLGSRCPTSSRTRIRSLRWCK